MTDEATHPLIEQLIRVDADMHPTGLYAAEKQQIWSKALYPILKGRNGKIGYARPGRYARFIDNDGHEGVIELLSFSAVKVRKFGDRFAVDARINYHERWDDRRIQKKICELWAGGDFVRRIFVIVAFDRSDNPFRRQLEQIAHEIDWESHGVTYAVKAWRDPRGRDFSCAVAVWEKNPTAQ